MTAHVLRSFRFGVLGLLGVLFWSISHSLFAEEKFSSGDWPFRPLTRPSVPTVKNSDWAKNPIDLFVLQKLEDRKLVASSEAEKLTLLRRATFDVLGLPPTVDEQDQFLADDAPDAYERLIDRLLDSPHFGQRWAQQWLDVVRFTESDGYKSDGPRLTAFYYRDYVIRALNDDLPYSQFIQQQLAGDLLEPDNWDAQMAVSFLRLFPEDAVASDMRQVWQDVLNDVTEVTGLAFMGITVGCARCHDHKFDPIKQSDFYRLQALFAPMLPVDRRLESKAESEDAERRQQEWNAATSKIREEMAALVVQHRANIRAEVVETYDPETQAAMNTPPEVRTTLQRQLCFLGEPYLNRRMGRAFRRLPDAERAKWDELEKTLAQFDPLKPPVRPLINTVVETPRDVPATSVLATGLLRGPLKGVVEAGPPEFLGGSVEKTSSVRLASNAPERPIGKRAAFARWLTQPDHPLTSRVMVNRIWQQHLGEGIVGTPNDFGVMGQTATHPELLDWLASELVANNWQLKHIHRLILTSATYRQSALVDDEKNPEHAKALEVDEDNKWLWHAHRRRLQGESVRDSMLFVAGTLNNRMAGPSAKPELPKAIMESRYAWQPDPVPADRNRRSVYVFVRRNLRYPVLAAFDAPDGFNSCAERAETVTVPQSLVLFNSLFAQDQAREWASDLLKAHGTDFRKLVASAYREAYGRKATTDELDAAERFMSQQKSVIDQETTVVPDSLQPEPRAPMTSPEQAAAVVDFCHALLNSTEFMYVE